MIVNSVKVIKRTFLSYTDPPKDLTLFVCTSTYGLDITELTICDFPADIPLPVMDAFDSYRLVEVPTRLVVYVKPHIVENVFTYTSELPALIVETIQGTYGFMYSPFTTNAYTKDRALV